MTFMTPGAVLAQPNIFSARTVNRIGGLLLGQLALADWAGLGHHVCHDLAPCSMGTKLFGYHNGGLDARECDKATC
jgi:hypothetical protein